MTPVHVTVMYIGLLTSMGISILVVGLLFAMLAGLI